MAVVALAAVGTALRCWRLDLGWFGVDQARDIQTALDIASGHDFPTVGPTMRRLTSLGALYHYAWAVPHFVHDDPLAAYGFASMLGVATMVAVWAFARRSWGPRVALVSLAVIATSPVAVIDGRVAWAPAALPFTAMTLLWLMTGTPIRVRLAALGAVLGIAVQLHLSMVAWGPAALVLTLVRWPGWRAVCAGVLGFVVTGFPALYAALANAGGDAGLSTLPSRGGVPDVGMRLLAIPALGWRVPSALSQWPDATASWSFAAWPAAVPIALAAVFGLTRLGLASVRRDWAAAAVLLGVVWQVAMVVLLPGDAWYYYLDALLPLWALAAGAGVAGLRMPDRSGRHPLADGATVLLVAAALVLGAQLAFWLGTAARHGYLVVHPAALTLDGGGGRDAAVPGRLLTVGSKREIAAVLGAERAAFPTRWRTTHGPAFDDVTGDNGFWLRRVSSPSTPTEPALRHAVLWYRDDPTAPSVPAPGFALAAVGPIVIARYHPAVLYDTCRDEQGAAVVVPIRVVPDPRRYGDGTIARPTTLPGRIDCLIAAGTDATSLVAAVTSGTVVLRDAAGRSGTTGRMSTLCVERGAEPVPFRIEVALPAGVASDLDLYERPDPTCAAKIAP